MTKHIFTGFGFGPIQSGLFVKEAYDSKNFEHFVISEIDQKLVDAVKANKGSYYVNIARSNCIDAVKIDNIELLNPNDAKDRQVLLEALAESTEMVTSLPSVNFYDAGGNCSVASLITEGLKNSKADATIIYTAENHNHAAEILEKIVIEKAGGALPKPFQFLNTVIAKMSGVITDPDEIKKLKLKTIAPGIDRAFLVEEFNRILVTKTVIPNFKPGIEVLIEKPDLLPFEEAKLYGHNAIHALLGFIGYLKGYIKMTDLKNDKAIMKITKDAFVKESGDALIKKYAKLEDRLFKKAGYREYAEDLLVRITNPYLNDTTIRAARDPIRKLGLNDRIFGTMILALEQGIEPENMAIGAAAGIAVILKDPQANKVPSQLSGGKWQALTKSDIEQILKWVWGNNASKFANQLIECVYKANKKLVNLINNG